MPVRDSLGRWIARADDLHAAALRRWYGASPLARRWRIVPYAGFGTAVELRVTGRVLRHVNHVATDAAHGAWRNFAEFWKHLESDELPGARVRATLAGVSAEAVADSEGHFDVTLAPAQPVAAGWLSVALELVDPVPRGQPVIATTEALVPPSSARFGIISDLDDTVVWSDVRRKLRMIVALARSNARTRKPFKGVAALYQALVAGASGGEGNPVFYVSNSPWNLHAPLVEFLDVQRLPRGPLMLRDFGEHLLFGSRGHGHKREAIGRVMDTYPALPFVLIGDSGERDPEIYADVVRDRPGRVRAIYIRSVDPDPSRIEAIDALIATVRAAGVDLVLAHDSADAAEHAAAAGLITAAAVADVRADRRVDERGS